MLEVARGISRCLVVHESFELSGADGVLELADCFSLDLADALTGDFEDSADFF